MTTIVTCPPTSLPFKDLHQIYTSSYASLYPSYNIPLDKFSTLLSDPAATVFLARQGDHTSDASQQGSTPIGAEDKTIDGVMGFALIYLVRNGTLDDPANQHLKGGLALLCVQPDCQSQGIGSALYITAISHLSSTILSSLDRSTPKPESGSIMLGSIFPRIFPGLPLVSGYERTKSYLTKRGWTFKEDLSYDLYRSLPGQEGLEGLERELKGLMGRAEGAGYRCGEYNGDREGLGELEREFGYATGWPDMILSLADQGFHQDIHCIYDPEEKIVGATAAALLDPAKVKEGKVNGMHDKMVWPNLVGKSCGSIGCVGISSKVRNPTSSSSSSPSSSSSESPGKGLNLGTALITSATLSLARRGADGVFIDWVREGLRGFYGKVGVEVWEVGYWGAEMIVKP